MTTLRLDICSDCLPDQDQTALSKLRGKLHDAFQDKVDLRLAPCMEQCKAPCVLTLQSANSAGYVFSGLNFDKDANDIIATCQAYFASDSGWIEDARPCGRLRFCLAARLPA